MARRLYLDEGLSASEVAKALGGGLTRGAVIGKINRMGLCKRVQPTGERAAARPASAPRIPSVRYMGPSWPPLPLPPLKEAPLQATPAVLADLVDGACRWPIDDPGPTRMHTALFCAAPAQRGGYCPAHQAIAAARAAPIAQIALRRRA